MHSRLALTLFSLALAGAAAAQAPPPVKPTFPTDKTPNGVADWVIKNLKVDGLTVIAARPTVSVWMAPDVDRDALPRVRFWERQEVLDAAIETELGARSLRVQKQIDCDRKLVRTLFVARYEGNNLTGFKDSTGAEDRSFPITPEMHETAEMALACATTPAPPPA